MTSAHCWISSFSRPALSLFPITLIAVANLAACAPVQPWERGRLAQAVMALDGNPMLSAMDEHVYSSKEASSGGVGPAGGGCGCN